MVLISQGPVWGIPYWVMVMRIVAVLSGGEGVYNQIRRSHIGGREMWEVGMVAYETISLKSVQHRKGARPNKETHDSRDKQTLKLVCKRVYQTSGPPIEP